MCKPSLVRSQWTPVTLNLNPTSPTKSKDFQRAPSFLATTVRLPQITLKTTLEIPNNLYPKITHISFIKFSKCSTGSEDFESYHRKWSVRGYIWSFEKSLLHFLNIYLFIYLIFSLWWVFIVAHGLSPVAEAVCGFSLRWLLLFESMALGVRTSVVAAYRLSSMGSAVVAHRLSCSKPRETFPDQGSDQCPLHWKADS